MSTARTLTVSSAMSLDTTNMGVLNSISWQNLVCHLTTWKTENDLRQLSPSQEMLIGSTDKWQLMGFKKPLIKLVRDWWTWDRIAAEDAQTADDRALTWAHMQLITRLPCWCSVRCKMQSSSWLYCRIHLQQFYSKQLLVLWAKVFRHYKNCRILMTYLKQKIIVRWDASLAYRNLLGTKGYVVVVVVVVSENNTHQGAST